MQPVVIYGDDGNTVVMPDTDHDILITGGAGFIGSHLTRYFDSNYGVCVIDILKGGKSPKFPNSVDVRASDIRGEDIIKSIKEADTVLHQAALVSVDESIEHPQASHSVNVEGTLNILEAARKYNIRIVLASSAAIYGHPKTIPISEEQRECPTSPYGLDKLSCDHYARIYHDRYGLETVALRYFNVYGPGQTGGDYAGVISVFIKQALNDEPITVHGDGEQTRDFVFVDDIVQANAKAVETENVGTGYNIGTGESISIQELAELIVEITDSSSDIVYTDPRPGDIEHSCADVAKAKSQLDYEPTVPIRKGLEQTVEWFQDYK